MSDRDREYEVIKERLTSPGASTQWAGRATDAGQILSSVIGGERGTSEPMMCGGAVAGIQPQGALLASQICNNTKKQNRTKKKKTVQICSDEREYGVSERGGDEESGV